MRQPTLLLIGATLMAMGAFYASVFPYQSLIAIHRFGLSEPEFGLVLVLASAVAVITSVLLGILSDKHANRRLTALVTTLTGSFGVCLMLIAPGPIALVLCHGIFFPIKTSLYGQVFALSHLATDGQDRERTAIQSTVRASMSLSYLVMLMFWTWAFANGADVMSIYESGAVASLTVSGLIYLFWPRDGQTTWRDLPSGQSLFETFRDIAHPHVLLRLVCLGAISSAGLLYMVLISLVFEASALRGTSDVALYIGMLGGWEVPFMLLMSGFASQMKRAHLIAIGAALYALQLALMPLLVDTPLLWALPLIGGMGAVAVIMVPIAYYQDLMVGRPGTAGSLLALQRLVGDLMAAAAFVVGTSLGGYQLTAFLGAAISVCGAIGLVLADRPKKP